MAPTKPTDADEENDIRWTDAQIRWPEDEVSRKETNEEEEDDDENPFDPFADPDPTEIFSFRFVTKRKKSIPATEPTEGATEDKTEDKTENDDESIRLEIHGYKTESDQVWESTGLTLWKASKYLCDYMVLHANKLRGQRVLEVSDIVESS
jgi:hypothetical protein